MDAVDQVLAIFAKHKGRVLVRVDKQSASIYRTPDVLDLPLVEEEQRVALSFKDPKTGQYGSLSIRFTNGPAGMQVLGFEASED